MSRRPSSGWERIDQAATRIVAWVSGHADLSAPAEAPPIPASFEVDPTHTVWLAWDPARGHSSKLVGWGPTPEAARVRAVRSAGRWWNAGEAAELRAWAHELVVVRVTIAPALLRGLTPPDNDSRGAGTLAAEVAWALGIGRSPS